MQLLEIVYKDTRTRYFDYTIREAVSAFRKQHGLERKRLGGELVVLGGNYPQQRVVATV